MRHYFVLGALLTAAAAAVACGDAGNNLLTNGDGSGGASGGASSGTVGGASSGGTSGGGTSGTSGASSGGASSSGNVPDAAPPRGKDAGPPPPASACVPNNIQTILNQQCVSCHANPPVGGSLSPLLNLADLLATTKENAAKNEAQLSALKLKGAGTSIMPPGSSAAANSAAAAAFDAWIASNYTLGCGSGGADAGSPPPPPANIWQGQPGFTAGSASQPEHSANDPRITRDCLDCHGGGGAPTWSAAGRLYDGAGNGVAGAQVRVAQADGSGGTTVYTDAIGLFWFQPGAFTAGMHTGARDAAVTKNMASAPSSGRCNSCHATGGSTARIHLP